MIKSSNNDISNITYGNNNIEKVYLGDSLIWPSKHLTPHLTPEFEVVDGIENASGNFEDVYDTSLNAWFKKAKQYDPSQDKIVTTSKYILYGDGFGGKEDPLYFIEDEEDYKTYSYTSSFFNDKDFEVITYNSAYTEAKTGERGSYSSYLLISNLRDYVPLYNQEISFKVDSLYDNYEFTLSGLGKTKIISNPFDPSTNGTIVSGKITIKPTTTYQTLVFQDLGIDEKRDYNYRRIKFSWMTPDTPIKKGYIKIKQNVYYPYFFEGMTVRCVRKSIKNDFIVYKIFNCIFENNEFKDIIEPKVQLTEDFPHNIPITRTIKTEWLEEGKDWQTDGGKAKDGFVYHTSNPYPKSEDSTPEKYIRFNKTDDYGNINGFIPWQAGLKYPDGNDSSMPKNTSHMYLKDSMPWSDLLINPLYYRYDLQNLLPDPDDNDSSMPKDTFYYTYIVHGNSVQDIGPYLYFDGVTDASSAQRLHFMSAYLYDMRKILPKKDKPHNNVKYSSVDELEFNEVPYVGMVAYIGSGPDYQKFQFVYENSEYTWKTTGETWTDTGENLSQ